MANDELKYIIRFQPHEGDLDEISERLKGLQDQFEDLGTEEAQEATKDYTEAMNEMNESNAEGIERLIELQEQIDGYKASLKEISERKKESGEIGEETARQEQEESAALKTTQQAYRNKQKLVMANQQAMEGNAATMGQMKAHLRELKVRMDNVPLDDTSGKLEELKEEWSDVNDTLKEHEQSMGDHRRNVGAYSEAISTAASSVAVFHGPLGPVAGRLTALNSTIGRAIPMIMAKAKAWGVLRLAMLASGVGIIAVALGTMAAALSRAQGAVDAVAGAFKPFTAAIDHAIDTVGYWIGVNEKNNLTMAESMQRARDLHRATIELEEAEIGAITTKAELQRQIASLRREAEDEAFTHEKRIDKLQEAMNLERELFDTRYDLQKRNVNLMQLQIEMTTSTREEEEELEEAKASLIRMEEQHETAMRQLTRRRQSVINSLFVEDQQRRRLIRTMTQQREEALKESAELASQAQRDTQARMEQWLIDRQIDAHRQAGRTREALELRIQQRMQEVRGDFSDKRIELEKNTREAIEAEMELLQKNNVDELEAELEARRRVEETHAEKEKEIRERIAEEQTIAEEKELESRQDHYLNFLEITGSEESATRLAQQVDLGHHHDRVKELESDLANFRKGKDQEVNDLKADLMSDNLDDEEAHKKAYLMMENRFRNNRIALARAENHAMRKERDRARQEEMDERHEQYRDRIMSEHDAMQEIALLEMEHTQRQLAIEQGRNEQIIQLEQQQARRVGELREGFVQDGMDRELAIKLAGMQAELEFRQQFADAEKAIAQENSQFQQDMISETANFATAALEAMFYDMKEARIAQAIINTAAAVSEALASGPPPLSLLRAATAAAAGAAQIRQIQETNIGDRYRPQVSGMERSVSDTGFTTVQNSNTGPSVSDSGRRMAQTTGQQDSNPTFIFEGDMDEEVMSIKARRGDKKRNAKSVNVISDDE